VISLHSRHAPRIIHRKARIRGADPGGADMAVSTLIARLRRKFLRCWEFGLSVALLAAAALLATNSLAAPPDAEPVRPSQCANHGGFAEPAPR
jgi:hypothetical protein